MRRDLGPLVAFRRSIVNWDAGEMANAPSPLWTLYAYMREQQQASKCTKIYLSPVRIQYIKQHGRHTGFES